MEEVTQKKVLGELAVIAFANVSDIVTVADGQLCVADIPPGTAAAVQSVEKTSTGIRVKFYDKLKALELLGKATGLFDGIPEPEQNNLLAAIREATGQEVDTDDLQEFQ